MDPEDPLDPVDPPLLPLPEVPTEPELPVAVELPVLAAPVVEADPVTPPLVPPDALVATALLLAPVDVDAEPLVVPDDLPVLDLPLLDLPVLDDLPELLVAVDLPLLLPPLDFPLLPPTVPELDDFAVLFPVEPLAVVVPEPMDASPVEPLVEAEEPELPMVLVVEPDETPPDDEPTLLVTVAEEAAVLRVVAVLVEAAVAVADDAAAAMLPFVPDEPPAGADFPHPAPSAVATEKAAIRMGENEWGVARTGSVTIFGMRIPLPQSAPRTNPLRPEPASALRMPSSTSSDSRQAGKTLSS